MKKQNNFLWILKGMAIVCVIFAHCENRVSACRADEILDLVRDNIGTIGVPLFFVISGYLYNNNRPFLQFIQNKVKLIYPWLFWGTIVWLYEVLRKGFDYANIVEWLLGIGTYLWFMPTIFLFWILFYYVRKDGWKKFVLALSIMLHLLIYEFPVLSILGQVPILNNVFCQMIFFTVGMNLRDKELNRIPKWLQVIGTAICLIIPLYFNEGNMRYHSKLFPLFALAGCVVCVYLAKMISKSKISKLFIWFGERSFLIYMIHMPIVGIISNLFSRSAILLLLVLLQPVLVSIIVYVGVNVLEWLCKKMKWLRKITGVKE